MKEVNKTLNKERLLEGKEDVPLYTIGVASRLLGCEPGVLRRYEKAGLIEPQRTGGKTRLYSENQLERLREIRELMTDNDVNMAGARMVVDLRDRIGELQEEIRSLKEEIALLKEGLAEK